MENTKFNKAKNNKLLLMFLLYVIFQGTSIILYTIGDYFDLSWTGESLLMAVICFLLYRTYASHTKNVMKPLIGAALAILLYYELDWGMFYIQYFDAMAESYPNEPAVMVFVVLQIALFATAVLINVMHYSINDDHHSSPKKIKTNKILFAIFAALILGQCVCELFTGSEPIIAFSNILGTLADVFMLNMIISIESNLDEYRIARESEAVEA